MGIGLCNMALLLNAQGIIDADVYKELPTIAQRMSKSLQDNLQRYETYFATVGGALNLKKCFY